MGFFDRFNKKEARVEIPKQVRNTVKPQYRNAFMASAVNRLTTSWYTTLLGPNRQIQNDVKRLRGLSRHLARNDVYTARYLSLVETRVVGPDGIHFQPRIQNSQLDYLEPVNTELVRGWTEWKTMAGIDGRQFIDIEQLAVKTVAQDGEVFVRVITDKRVNKYGIALQLMDADLLDNDYNDLNAPNNNTIVQGVEVDRLGVVVAYHFWTQHPDDFKNGVTITRERIEADEILHLYRPDRVGQLRGLPWTTKSMYFIARLHEYMDAELVAAQAAASQIATIETADNDASAYLNNDQREVLEMEPGVMIRLAPGEKMNPWNSARPTNAFDPFVKTLLHGIASGFNVSYSTLASDMSEDNYSSARMSGNYEQKFFDNLQMWFIRMFHEKVYRLWLNSSMSLKAVDLTGDLDDFTNVIFRGMKMQSPDLLKDLNAASVGFENDVISKTQWCAERGYDYREVLSERYEEKLLERQYEKDLKDMGLDSVTVQDELVITEAENQLVTDDVVVEESRLPNDGDEVL